MTIPKVELLIWEGKNMFSAHRDWSVLPSRAEHTGLRMIVPQTIEYNGLVQSLMARGAEVHQTEYEGQKVHTIYLTSKKSTLEDDMRAHKGVQDLFALPVLDLLAEKAKSAATEEEKIKAITNQMMIEDFLEDCHPSVTDYVNAQNIAIRAQNDINRINIILNMLDSSLGDKQADTERAAAFLGKDPLRFSEREKQEAAKNLEKELASARMRYTQSIEKMKSIQQKYSQTLEVESKARIIKKRLEAHQTIQSQLSELFEKIKKSEDPRSLYQEVKDKLQAYHPDFIEKSMIEEDKKPLIAMLTTKQKSYFDHSAVHIETSDIANPMTMADQDAQEAQTAVLAFLKKIKPVLGSEQQNISDPTSESFLDDFRRYALLTSTINEHYSTIDIPTTHFNAASMLKRAADMYDEDKPAGVLVRKVLRAGTTLPQKMAPDFKAPESVQARAPSPSEVIPESPRSSTLPPVPPVPKTPAPPSPIMDQNFNVIKPIVAAAKSVLYPEREDVRNSVFLKKPIATFHTPDVTPQKKPNIFVRVWNWLKGLFNRKKPSPFIQLESDHMEYKNKAGSQSQHSDKKRRTSGVKSEPVVSPVNPLLAELHKNHSFQSRNEKAESSASQSVGQRAHAVAPILHNTTKNNSAFGTTRADIQQVKNGLRKIGVPVKNDPAVENVQKDAENLQQQIEAVKRGLRKTGRNTDS